ncbi:MAG: MFS transporter, partial [Clostridia bacterium]
KNSDAKMYFNWFLIGFSAISATAATLIGGALSDRLGKRKVFVSYGYIIWGISTMAFALIPTSGAGEHFGAIIFLVIVMDCIMSFIGAVANDAALNAWLTDYSDTTNRGKLDTIIGMMPVLSTVLLVLLFDNYTNANKAEYNWQTFFILAGVIPIVVGILGIFVLKDKKGLIPVKNDNYWKDVFYGFRKDVIHKNKFLYICLFGSMTAGASIQVYMGSLFTFVEYTLGIKDYILPLGIAIVLAIVISITLSVFMDKFGKAKFYYPIIVVSIIGCIIAACTRFVLNNMTAKIIFLAVGAAMIMATSLLMSGLFIGAFRDYIPKGKEGSFQGIRMFIFVCIPMMIGPGIAAGIGSIIGNIDSMAIYAVVGDATRASLVPPPEIFWGAAIFAALTFIPAYFVKHNDHIIRAKLISERDAMLKQDSDLDVATEEK